MTAIILPHQTTPLLTCMFAYADCREVVKYTCQNCSVAVCPEHASRCMYCVKIGRKPWYCLGCAQDHRGERDTKARRAGGCRYEFWRYSTALDRRNDRELIDRLQQKYRQMGVPRYKKS